MSSPPPKRYAPRAVSFAILFVITAVIFLGGSAALLYWLFSQYSGVRNIWILFCGAPFVLGALVIFTMFNLYIRLGRPMEQLFKTIKAVEKGDFSARAPEVKSDMYTDLIKRFNRMVSELERAEQQRRNLTADIAHELRTPLHIIQGNLEGILDGVYQPSSEHINATLDETRLLTRLVNDLQTLSLAETGHLPLHLTHFPLTELMTDLTSSFSSQAASLGIDLKTYTAGSDIKIKADYDRLNQVLSNLISNALRHTPGGGTVSVQANALEMPAANVNFTLQIIVSDTGAGISAEDLPFIFDRFWRRDKSRSQRTHSGLGLAIAKQLLHAHGGTIEVKSELGNGTTFTIELPQ